MRNLFILLLCLIVLSCSEDASDSAFSDSYENMTVESKNISLVAVSSVESSSAITTKDFSPSDDSEEEIYTLTYCDSENPDVLQPLVFLSDKGNKVILGINEAKTLGEGIFICDVNSVKHIRKVPDVIEEEYTDSKGNKKTRKVLEPLEVEPIETYGDLRVLVDIRNSKAYRFNLIFNRVGNSIETESYIIFGYEGTMYRMSKDDVTKLVPLNNAEYGHGWVIIAADNFVVYKAQSSTGYNEGIKLINPSDLSKPPVAVRDDHNILWLWNDDYDCDGMTCPPIYEIVGAKYKYNDNVYFCAFGFLLDDNSETIGLRAQKRVIVTDPSFSVEKSYVYSSGADSNEDGEWNYADVLSAKKLADGSYSMLLWNSTKNCVVWATLTENELKMDTVVYLQESIDSKTVIVGNYACSFSGKKIWKQDLVTGAYEETLEFQNLCGNTLSVVGNSVCFTQYITATDIGTYKLDLENFDSEPVLFSKSSADVVVLQEISF